MELNDTTCRQVSNRDQQLRQFAAAFDKIVFVSGIKSSNGRSCTTSANCKRRHLLRQPPDEVQAGWFSPNDRVGICGATSTPMWLMEAVRDRLHSFDFRE